MMTFKQFSEKIETIPASTSWYLADLSEARVRQELFTRQAPQRLMALREYALIRRILQNLQATGKAECLGRGPGATWHSNEVITLKRG